MSYEEEDTCLHSTKVHHCLQIEFCRLQDSCSPDARARAHARSLSLTLPPALSQGNLLFTEANGTTHHSTSPSSEHLPHEPGGQGKGGWSLPNTPGVLTPGQWPWEKAETKVSLGDRLKELVTPFDVQPAGAAPRLARKGGFLGGQTNSQKYSAQWLYKVNILWH